MTRKRQDYLRITSRTRSSVYGPEICRLIRRDKRGPPQHRLLAVAEEFDLVLPADLDTHELGRAWNSAREASPFIFVEPYLTVDKQLIWGFPVLPHIGI